MATAALQVSTGMFRVLVVEDEGIIALDIQRSLERLRFVVTRLVSSASEALDAIAEEPPDVVLMDVRIQGPTDGIQAAELVRDRFHIPVIYLTGQADARTLDRANASGHFGYLIKPFKAADLKVAIDTALQAHRQVHQTKALEMRRSALLGRVSEAVAVADKARRITYLNPSAEELLGLTTSEASGQEWNTMLGLNSEQVPSELPPALPETRRDDQIHVIAGQVELPDGAARHIIGAIASVQEALAADGPSYVMLLQEIRSFRSLNLDNAAVCNRLRNLLSSLETTSALAAEGC